MGKMLWNKGKQTLRQREGFTLLELLFVVAIVLVLTLVAMFSLSAIQKQLRQKELDSKAEVLYMAAQNRIAELRAAGYENSYQPDSGTNGVERLGYVPCDAEATTTLTNDTICCVSSGDKGSENAAAAKLLSASSVETELYDQNWRIEFDPISGSIYAVFYSESGSLPEGEAADPYRSRDYRLKQGALVGYYGGDVTSIEAVNVLKPEIRIVNAEELTAMFYCTVPSGTEDDLTFTIRLSDGTNRYEKVIAEPTKINSRTYRYEWVLDSLKSDAERFYNQTEAKLLCGTALDVTLIVSSSDPRIDDESASVRTNSLFADPRSDTDAGTALIACGRHLQNLDAASHVAESITDAVQISDISFADNAADDEDWYSCYGSSYYCSGGFHPISNEHLKSYTGRSVLNGETLYFSIDSLRMEKPNDCTDLGLFECFSGRIEDVTLTGAKIGTAADTATCVGALVGRTSGDLELSGCRVSLSAQKGDLTGLSQVGTPSDVKPWLQGGTVGGLIGSVDSGDTVVLDYCLAASVLNAAQNAGGLIGTVNGSATVECSYADCYLQAATTGGLVGGMGSGAELSLSCFYAAGYQTASSAAAGLVPGSVRRASNGYAAFDYTGAPASIYTTAADASQVSAVYYLSGFGSASVSLSGTEAKTYHELSDQAMLDLLGTDFTLSSGSASFPYNLLEQGLTYYTYPRLSALEHYGDWEAEFKSGALVYYEAYSDGSYGFSGSNTEVLRSQTAIGDGYAIAYDQVPPSSISITAFGTTEDIPVTEANTFQVTDSRTQRTFYLVKLSDSFVNPADAQVSAAFYQSIQVDGTEYFFNPYFAKTVTVNETRPKAAGTISVRTARQLYALSRLYSGYADETSGLLFQQELDIDYGSYAWKDYAAVSDTVVSQAPITAESGFAAVYDGVRHTIRGVSFRAADGNLGMFGLIAKTAEVRNVFLLAAEDGSTVSYESVAASGSRSSVNMGALAGRNNGSIRNCVVNGYSMTYYGYNYNVLSLGGLVGVNYGIIRNCEANTADVQIAATNASSYVGGFVGSNHGSVAVSYALGQITVTDARNSTVWIAGFAANNSNGIVRRCYSATALTATGTTEPYGFAHTGGTTANCFYLDGGTYSYAGALYTYNTSKNEFAALYASGTPITGAELAENDRLLTDFSLAQASYEHEKTGAETDAFPYPAIVSDASGATVHYGDWPMQQDIGSYGLFYWEYEDGGSNKGYHFSYAGFSREATGDDDGIRSGSSLCEARNDGGVITDYGYGYYYQTDAGTTPTLGTENCKIPSSCKNEEASKELDKQMYGYTFVAYNTASAESGTDGIYLNTAQENATWTLSDGAGNQYRYTVSPFFADAFSLDSVNGTAVSAQRPGTQQKPYEIRSVRQLQFINWNYGSLSAETSVTSSNVTAKNNGVYQRTQYTYLVYSDEAYSANTAKDLYWVQSHDADAYEEYGEPTTPKQFTPIGCLYERNTDLNSAKSNPYLELFTSSFDGKSYALKNIEIRSSVQCIGLFGVTAAAELKNIVMYSDRGNVIENESGGTNWYAVGGLVGFATRGNETLSQNRTGTIRNCTVSGYQIIDNRTNTPGWGGGNVGGLVGATNMDLSGCTAVTDITLQIGYREGYKNLRVGGIVGAARSTISYCYAGGSIVSTASGTYSSDSSDSAATTTSSIWVSGIAGGVVLRCQGKLGDLIGEVQNSLKLYNCYSYVQLPKTGSNLVAASQSIASNGELQNNIFTLDDGNYKLKNTDVYLYNCYCLSSKAENTDDYQNKRGSSWSTSGVDLNKRNNGSGRHIYIYNSSTPYLAYDAMVGEAFAATLNNKAYTDIPADLAFGTVTVTEHDADIAGKYSFPGNDASLDGLDYPFPTILTQTDPFGQTVNVHYGAWPESGLLWQEPSASFDLLADADASGAAELTWKLYDLSGGSTAATPTVTVTQEDAASDADTGAVSALTATVGTYQSAGDGDVSAYYPVRFAAQTPGTYLVTAAQGETTATLRLTVTAELNITAEQLLTVGTGETCELVLTTTDAHGDPFVPTSGKALSWEVTVSFVEGDSQTQPVECFANTIQAQASSGTYTLPVKGNVAGEATIQITCTYPLGSGTAVGRTAVSAVTED